jgi:hypothetical protein
MAGGLGFRLLEGVAATGFVAYCGWWTYWLLQGQLPAAPLKALTGLPAPTTGFTRGLAALWAGDVATSLHYNALAVPILALFLASLGWLAVRGLQRRPLLVPRTFLYLWVAVLAAAWMTKLFGDPRYW